jgi:hypothetical protein
VFIGYHRVPQWAGLWWLKTIPKLHFVTTILSTIVIPIVVIIQTLASLGAIHSSLFSGPLLLYPFVSFCVLVRYPFIFLPKLKEDSQVVAKLQAKMERWLQLKKGASPVPSVNPTEETLLDKEFEEEKKLFTKLFKPEYSKAYLDLPREPGCGPVRINSKLTLGNDLYSLLFVSYFNWELVKKAEADLNKENELWDEMLTEHVEKQQGKQNSFAS